MDLWAASRADGLEIQVADRGPGIPPLAKGELFEKFGGVFPHSGDRRSFGLGLYQVRLAVRAHGGEVRAHDRVGGGTVFTMVLPA